MQDEQTNEGDTEGEELNNDSSETEKVRKDTEELKAQNDAYDKQRLRAETIRAEKQRGGISNAGQQEKQTVSPEDKKKAQAKEFFKGTALGDAIVKANE